MKPPRRATRHGGVGTAGTARDRVNLISRTFTDYLKPVKGWRYFTCGPDDWSFIPPSLLPNDPKQLANAKRNIFKYGTQGIHYAYGWSGLADMIETYGKDYAPTTVFSDDGIVTPVPPAAAPASFRRPPRRVSVSFALQEEDRNEQNVQGQVISENDNEEEEEAQPTGAVATTNTQGNYDAANISELMSCIEKCNTQITWINNNPDEQSLQEAQEQKQDLLNTKRAAHAQLRALHDQVVL